VYLRLANRCLNLLYSYVMSLSAGLTSSGTPRTHERVD
jgi:hypothetical protein